MLTDLIFTSLLDCTKMLEDLQKEKQQFENWLNYIGEVSVSIYLNIAIIILVCIENDLNS